MKQSFMNGISRNALLIIALVAVIIFSANKKPGIEDVTARCCNGYDISMNDLKQFMLDSLHGDQFEGGVYSKASLLAAINKIPGDSIYLMNSLKNCSITQGTDLALTSPTASGVIFVSKPGCYPCPPKACCPQRVCATSINRSCVNYKKYQGFSNGSALKSVTADK